jgi:hypothetical protein
MHCSFAHPGTYGHECGKPAVKVSVKKSDLTVNGLFFAGRCEECTHIKGGENVEIINTEAFDSTRHINKWR